MTTPNVLNIQDLNVVIDRDEGLHEAVRALGISVRQGETFALVGESGSGKSLTALSVLRLLPPAIEIASGQIDLQAQDLNRLPEMAMQRIRGGRVGMIFQEPGTSLNPIMRVGDQLLEIIRLHTDLVGQAAVDRAIYWLGRVGLPDPETRLHDYPFQFSGGQKQRIMIAMALAAEPALLVADEPTTALDVMVQAQILDLLKSIQEELGMAILLITHDLAIVRKVADTVALMRHGQIVQTLPADQFFTQPDHPYAWELFDAVPTFEKRGQPLSAEGRDRASQTETLIETSSSQSSSNQALSEEPSESADVVLKVRNLRVSYPIRKGWLRRVVAQNAVVQGVDFDLQRGKTLALLGPSGCGKTTIAKTLVRLLDQTARIEGQAWLHGESLLDARGQDLARMRARLQIVFQDPYASLDPRMRIGEILQEGIVSLVPNLTKAQRDERVQMLLERVGLPQDSAMRFAHEFSGGQRQRIAIARALAVEPDVLVLDEPTSALDVSVQAQILDLLSDLQKSQHMAYIFITHNFSVVEYFADQVAVMDQGRFVELGAAEDVLMRPQHAMTKALLEAVPRLSFGEY